MPTRELRGPELGEIPRRSDLLYTDRFSKEWLAEQRHVGDPLGDRVVAELQARHPARTPDDMLAEIERLAEEEGGIFQEFLDACHDVPPWADFPAMEAGRRMFATMGPLIGMSILGGGVAGSAFHVDAEPVFTATGRFVVERGVSDRLAETGSILFLIPLPGEVEPGGRHHRVVMKVRVLHSAIRNWLLSSPDSDYPADEVGVPINQEDMAYALLIFTYLNVRGLLRLGVTISDEQIDSLHLLWRWVGHVIGIDERWLCEDIETQREFYKAFLASHARKGEASIAALNLLDGAIAKVPGPLREPARRTLHRVTAELGGREYLEGLKLEQSGGGVGWAALRGVAAVYDAMLRAPGGEAVLHWWGVRRIRKQYSSFGNPADEHGYGATFHNRSEIEQAMARRREKLDTS